MAFVRPLGLTPLRPIFSLSPAVGRSIYSHQHQPIRLQQNIYQPKQHGIRHYSRLNWSNEMGIDDMLAYIPAEVMHLLANTGLPWYAVIPTTAILVRTLFVYPFLQKPVRIQHVRRLAIRPLRDVVLVDQITSSKYDPKTKANQLVRLYLKNKSSMDVASRVFDQHLFPAILPRRLGQFLTLIVMTDVMRKLSGYKGGLLSMIFGKSAVESTSTSTASSFAAHSPTADPSYYSPAIDSPTTSSSSSSSSPTIDSSSSSPTIDPSSLSSATIDPSSSASPTIEPSSSSSPTIDPSSSSSPTTDPSSSLAIDSPWFEPELLTGGFSWCPDLTQADPTLILPFLFSASFVASIYFAPRIREPGQTGPPDLNTMQRIFMSIAVMSIYPALNLPVALHLYLIPNIWMGFLQSRWLLFTMPLIPSPTACKRPCRAQPFNELKDEFTDEFGKSKSAVM